MATDGHNTAAAKLIMSRVDFKCCGHHEQVHRSFPSFSANVGWLMFRYAAPRFRRRKYQMVDPRFRRDKSGDTSFVSECTRAVQ